MLRNLTGPILLSISLIYCFGCEQKPYRLSQQRPPTESLLIGLSVMNEQEVWASGTNAVVIRTIDGGNTWEKWDYLTIDSLEFRDIHGFGQEKCIVMSSGPGKKSRILLLENEQWEETYVMENPNGFLDCIDFWDANTGIAYGDSFDGSPFILRTTNGGADWTRVVEDHLPAAGYEEGGFAASGTCIELGENGHGWIGTGAGGNARILYTRDYGRTWDAQSTPMPLGPVSGITSVRFIDQMNGFITGGDLVLDTARQVNSYFTRNGGETWVAANPTVTRGAFYGSVYLPWKAGTVALVNGPHGVDISFDQGDSWSQIHAGEFWTSDMTKSGIGWLMGRNGAILKIELN